MWKLSVATLVLRSKRAETRRAFHSFLFMASVHIPTTIHHHHLPDHEAEAAAVVVPTSLKTFVDVVVEGQ